MGGAEGRRRESLPGERREPAKERKGRDLSGENENHKIAVSWNSE